MPPLFAVDWHGMFVPSVSLLEIVLRGTIIYLAIYLIFRLLPREPGAFSISDFLVVVLIADASQNAMAADYKSITEGILLILTIVGWDFLFDWLGEKFPALRPLLRPPPLLLIDHGRVLKKNLRREMLSEDELLGQLRQQGIESFAEVKKCRVESDGELSVIKRKPDDDVQKPREKGPV
jgi:uncharacterized membrane protein YcaP (DUF421 family)